MHRTTWVVVAALASATGVQAQNVRPDSAAPAPAQRPDTAKRAAVPSLTAHVFAPNGRPLPGAIVTATFPAEGEILQTRKDTSDAAGRFGFDTLASGAYKIRIEHSAMRSYTTVDTINGEVTRTFVLTEPSGAQSREQTVWTFICLVLYGVSILFARWNHIARSVHAIIRRQLTALKTRLATEVDPSQAAQVAALTQTVDNLCSTEEEYAASWNKFGEFAFWSRGHENASWIAIHEIERQLAAFIAPSEQVDVYLRWAEAELRQIQKPTATVMADAIHRSLEAPAPLPAELASQQQHRRALLGRSIAILNTERDNNFSTLMEWQNKSAWLLLASMIIILFLTGTVGRAVLFLAGASGGFVSRVSRALRRDDVPLDYGASWATLFLSPLFGAFTGWFGVALIVLAASPTLNVLGPAFKVVDWDNPFGPITLGIAFVLGFSERFFGAIVGAVEDRGPTTAGNPGGKGPAAVVPPALPPAANPPAAGGGPAISEITRQAAVAGVPRDVLQVRGSGFDKAATASVNNAPRDVEFQTPEALLILLREEDGERIDAGGETVVVIANPGGAVSKPTPFE